jgi:hypothetical protein
MKMSMPITVKISRSVEMNVVVNGFVDNNSCSLSEGPMSIGTMMLQFRIIWQLIPINLKAISTEKKTKLIRLELSSVA